MPLDPTARALLDAGAALDARNPGPPSPASARAEFRRSALGLARTPTPVGSVEDRDVPGPGGAIPIRIYRPHPDRSRADPGPIVYFHGGGFVLGDLDTHDDLCRRITVGSGRPVVSVAYRVAPEHPHPAPIDDAEAATRWVMSHGGTIGLDPDRVVVAGDSAGGTLAITVALRLREAGAPPLAGLALLYPIADWRIGRTGSYREFASGFGLTADRMRWFAGHYLPVPALADDPDVSPLLSPHLAGLPPTLVLTSECDVLRDEAEALADRLRDASVPTTSARVAGSFHGFLRYASLLESARVGLAELTAWLGRLDPGGSGLGAQV